MTGFQPDQRTGRFAIAVESARDDGSAPVRGPEEGDAVQRAWHGTVAVVRGLAGLDKYDRYVAHQSRTHPDEPLLSEAEFWRCSWDAEGRNPKARCC
ncbi:YbdD/YjiX family protein [Raineyella fluvialis]|uniref:Putative selenoprotein n=1 Tax=Raineyella fluvialis TaxID=2662261 RepID=A0A5Q2F9Q3_9ACTN|nr:YbdD/YjiX family protein [Raineyella fluvialis]QGF23700.1 putative selenoprotein [Raineyella fluvialis]